MDKSRNEQPKASSTTVHELRTSNEGEVKDRAEAAASGDCSSFGVDASKPVIKLDPIWKLDGLISDDLCKYVKVRTTTMSFPEKLMLMLMHIERCFAKSGLSDEQAPIIWLLEGRAFSIQGTQEDFTKRWLPKFFPQAKFQSFTRKLYRWGFRQVNLSPQQTAIPPNTNPPGTIKDRELVFAHPFFQRDRYNLMTYMRSITAATARRESDRRNSETGQQQKTMNVSSTSLSLSVVEVEAARQGSTPAPSLTSGSSSVASLQRLPMNLTFPPPSSSLGYASSSPSLEQLRQFALSQSIWGGTSTMMNSPQQWQPAGAAPPQVSSPALLALLQGTLHHHHHHRQTAPAVAPPRINAPFMGTQPSPQPPQFQHHQSSYASISNNKDPPQQVNMLFAIATILGNLQGGSVSNPGNHRSKSHQGGGL